MERFSLLKLTNIFWLPKRVNRIRHFAITGIYCFIICFVGALFKKINSDFYKIITLIFSFYLIVNYLVLKIKRMHDFNASGWLILLFLVPVLNVIWGLIIFIISGSENDNLYGSRPQKANKLEYLIALLWVPCFFLTAYLLVSHF